MKKLLFLFFWIVLVSSTSAEVKSKPLVYKINIKQEIGPASFINLQNGLHHANEMKADYILIEMNTYGGYLTEADSMRTAIINSKIPVSVFINNNAASAGALISIACKKIYMTQSANIGAATVVEMGTGARAPDKYQSYMRALIRSTAESQGKDTLVSQTGAVSYKWKRDPLVAEAMVDERVVIPNVVDSSKVLTLTAEEAVKLGYCDGIAENANQVITKYMGLTNYDLETYNSTFFDHIKGFLMNGLVQSILIMLIIGGIFFEVKMPGTGLPIAIALTAAILYFSPLYMDGYAQNWEILAFVIGLILIAFEIFVIPGFGVAGITGIILTITGLFLSLIDNIGFDFKGIPADDFTQSVFVVFGGLFFGLFIIFYFANKIGKGGALFKHIANNTDQEGFVAVSEEPKKFVGETGVAATVLRPSGMIIINGEYLDAVSVEGFIEKGKNVKVLKYKSSQLYVIEI